MDSFSGGGSWTKIPNLLVENGTRDQHSDALVNELNTHFDKCQQLLNSISSSINAKAVMVDGEKRKLDERYQLLNQRRELIGNYRNSVKKVSQVSHNCFSFLSKE
ncbi:mediator of RNA polymerase II transcription subunit 9-like [Populus nigra]|uniref:mediator of RNA polymerase II transcription subunit 9-like n=1 Tax=Populus nigra TaxID=3691 RepID=UPI002B26B939|nr:mediator of RNA polymerase II transcription subunit 9-like [Populus nigra]